jgi:hypothetical protein
MKEKGRCRPQETTMEEGVRTNRRQTKMKPLRLRRFARRKNKP